MTEFKCTASAHAKLNLTLDVGPLRSDGYHDIDSVVVRLSIADDVTVHLRQGTGKIRLIVKDKRPDRIAHPPLPKGAENLAYRAAQLCLDAWSPEPIWDIWCTLVKKLPAEAGLGGGSSDAASVLRLMAAAFDRPIDTVNPMARQLGSDVPLFLEDRPQRMRGRGEQLSAVPELPKLHGVVVRPIEGVPTRNAYALLDTDPARNPGRKTPDLLDDPKQLHLHCGNDFQLPVSGGYPGVANALAAVVSAGARFALLCGSGSAVFGAASDRDQAVGMARTLAAAFPYVKVVETLP